MHSTLAVEDIHMQRALAVEVISNDRALAVEVISMHRALVCMSVGGDLLRGERIVVEMSYFTHSNIHIMLY